MENEKNILCFDEASSVFGWRGELGLSIAPFLREDCFCPNNRLCV
jgi:hypothetical protein